ncbi:MAG: class I SAM-dependent methyltransferase [Streptosporangiaceae bacterium]
MEAATDEVTARQWIERWERQQEAGLPHREERFTALVDVVQAATGRPDPLVLDVGCGPGSLAVRLLDRLPEATVVGIDIDPVTLALGRAAYGDKIIFTNADLRAPDWPSLLPASRPVDAAVSTTALHWLTEDALRSFYQALAEVLRPGGVFLNGDHLREDPKAAPELARLGRALNDLEDLRRFPGGHDETWTGWWDAVAADPVLGPLASERAALDIGANHGESGAALLYAHVEALRAAGFAEIGTLWQHGASRLLCAIR